MKKLPIEITHTFNGNRHEANIVINQVKFWYPIPSLDFLDDLLTYLVNQDWITQETWADLRAHIYCASFPVSKSENAFFYHDNKSIEKLTDVLNCLKNFLALRNLDHNVSKLEFIKK